MFPDLEAYEEEIKSFISKEFTHEKIINFKLVSQRVNAHFLIETKKCKSILRIYRDHSCWLDSESSYLFEIELMNYLRENDFVSSFPLNSKFLSLDIGVNQLRGFLMSYAEGDVSCLSANESFLFGEVVGEFHKLTNDFDAKEKRFEYNQNFLIEESYMRLSPYAKKLSKEKDLDRIYSYLSTFFSQLSNEQLDFGIIHGDFNGENHHIDKKKNITIYDFDMSGYGFREYDLAVFLRVCLLRKIDVFDDFVRGYSKSYQKPKLNLASLTNFALCRHFWQMGLLSTFPENTTYYEDYLKKELAFGISILESIEENNSKGVPII